MSIKLLAYLHILFTPFVVSAAIEFLPFWLAWPVVLLGSMTWIGSCIILAEKE